MFSIALLLIAAGIAYISWLRGLLQWTPARPNSDFPIGGHTSVKSALMAWKAHRSEKRADKASKRGLACHAIEQLSTVPQDKANEALLADNGLLKTRLRCKVRARWQEARRETVEELQV